MHDDTDLAQNDRGGDDDITSLEEGKILDDITNDPLKNSPKEQVRQRIARALFHEHAISSTTARRWTTRRSSPRW